MGSGGNTVVIHGVQQSRLQCNPLAKATINHLDTMAAETLLWTGGFRDERVGFCIFFLLTRKERDNLIFTSLVKNDEV